jgi:hypothetical protein
VLSHPVILVTLHRRRQGWHSRRCGASYFCGKFLNQRRWATFEVNRLGRFNVSTIIIEVAIKGLSCIEENRLLTTDNVISPGTTCDLTQDKTRMSGFSRDSHVTRWEPCMIQVSAFQSPALWVSRETEMLLLHCQRVLDVCPTSKICIPLTTYCNANILLF